MPGTKKTEKPKTQSEIFEEERKDAFLGQYEEVEEEEVEESDEDE